MFKEFNFITENLEFVEWYTRIDEITGRKVKSKKNGFYTLKFKFNQLEYDIKLTENKYEELKYELDYLRKKEICKLVVSYDVYYVNTRVGFLMRNIFRLEDIEVIKNGKVANDHHYLQVFSIDKGIFTGIKKRKDNTYVWFDENGGQGYVQLITNNNKLDLLIRGDQVVELVKYHNISIFKNNKYKKYIKFSVAKRDNKNSGFTFLFDELSEYPFVIPIKEKKKASNSIEYLQNLEEEYCTNETSIKIDISNDRLPW